MARGKYHHGNLKTALVDAVLSLIQEKGPHGFSVAEAARRAGVSPAAPYRHFKDRDELMIETARRGYEVFAERLDEAWDNGRPYTFAAFERVGAVYLGFAKTEPAYFSAMFETGISPSQDPELAAATERALGVLRQACEAVAMQVPPERRPPVQMMTYHIWAMAHGVTALFGRADDGRLIAPFSADELLESVVGVYLRGLDVLP